MGNDEQYSVQIMNGSFSWTEKKLHLSDINVSIKKVSRFQLWLQCTYNEASIPSSSCEKFPLIANGNCINNVQARPHFCTFRDETDGNFHEWAHQNTHKTILLLVPHLDRTVNIDQSYC